MIKEIIISLLFIFLIIIAICLLYKRQKDFLFKLALIYCKEAEEYFHSQKGKNKLIYVVESIRKVLPWWLDFLISEKALRTIIEDALSYLQSLFSSSKEKQIAAVNEVLKLTTKNYDLDKSAKTVIDTINSDGYVEGYAEVKSNLHGDHNVQAGIRAGLKF